MQTTHLRVIGMSCGACANTVKGALQAVNGVNDVQVELEEAHATVQYDEHQTSSEQLVSAVSHVGFGAQAV
ncbi:heavy-metal-associated domain-containing protein [Methylobacillus caricis]|uniref:heavy-metal-associated domain-containing protein n=1 Tax=Methylobacillus caricis TaxID=1971611 RepID=UPI001CFFF963|nr:heavy-metal-associated domain-containing protein [Methylobacillus caricis]MCB5189022.1 heavy-metal-associated domain-containing protein [Methylobacillus caricis]